MTGGWGESCTCLVVLNDLFECRPHTDSSGLRNHAAAEPLETAAMAAMVDACVHARWRWVVLVALRRFRVGFSRCRKVCRPMRSNDRGRYRDTPLPIGQEGGWTQAA